MLARRSVCAEQVSQAVLGTRVRLRDAGGHWLRIVTPDGYEGWTPTRAVSRSPYPPAAEEVEIDDLWVNLRPRPDSRAPSWLTAFVGCRLNLRERRGGDGEESGWLGLELPAGGLAWLEAHRAHPVGARLPATPASIVATAERFIGVPYLWGGCTPLGLDCSGLVQLVYRLAGLGLPRDAYQQAACGEPLPAERLEAGDLLFFGAPSARDGRITHVGIARGDGSFLHAAGGRGVQANRLAEKEYSARFLCARRIVKVCV
jgi:hypothetical protein